MTPLLTISGTFYRAVRPERLNDVLQPPDQTSAGRYHRHGQAALYMSPSLEWSRIAVSGYMREDGLSRLIVPLQVDDAHVFDQRDRHACAQLGIDRNLSNASWRQALQDGEIPPSWPIADAARNIPADGIVDISRHIPQGWHLNLFRWNDMGGPQVKVIGEPTEVHPKTHGAKWS